jgi:hypothetical protein
MRPGAFGAKVPAVVKSTWWMQLVGMFARSPPTRRNEGR